MITQTLKMVFNIQSTLSHLGFDKSYSNLIYIPIAERIPLTNHAQILILTKRRLKYSDNFLLFIYIVFTWNGQVFIPIALYPHEIKLLQSWLIFRLDTCVYVRKHTDTDTKWCFSSMSCLFERGAVCLLSLMLTTKSKHRRHSNVCVSWKKSTLAHSLHWQVLFYRFYICVIECICSHTVYVCCSATQVHLDYKAVCCLIIKPFDL